MLHGGERVQRELFTEVKVLDENEFIDYYAGILGLRDNVSTAHSLGDNILYVYPDTYEGRIMGHDLFAEGLRRIGAIEDAENLRYPQPPKDPMPFDEITELADRIREIKERQRAFSELSVIKKVGHSVLLMVGAKTLAVSAEEDRLSSLPNAIEFTEEGTGIREVVINSASDEPIPQLLDYIK